MTNETQVFVFDDEPTLVSQLANLIAKVSQRAIRDRGVFNVGVSGGSLINFLRDGLPGINTTFSKWKIFFNDERLVPFDDEDSTYGAYVREVAGRVGLTEDQFVKIRQGVSADEAAQDYQQKIAQHFNNTTQIPSFDMLLLGMGPDGHTCSLFPDHPLLEEKTAWVAPIVDSPKPPPQRVTLTYPVLNKAKYVVFAISGAQKADMIKQVVVEKRRYPSTLVKPEFGKVLWLLDEKAAVHVSKDKRSTFQPDLL